jgi:hypothetical protein
MKIKTITYSRTWQIERFEPEHVEATMELAEEDDVFQSMLALKAFVVDSSETVKMRNPKVDSNKLLNN